MAAKTLTDLEREEADKATPVPSTPKAQPQPEPEPFDLGPIKRDAAPEQAPTTLPVQTTVADDLSNPYKDCKGCEFEDKAMPYIRVVTAAAFALFILALIYLSVKRAQNLALPI